MQKKTGFEERRNRVGSEEKKAELMQFSFLLLFP
jgi:hypothetical protein